MIKREWKLRYWRSLNLEKLPALAVDCQFLKLHSPRARSLAFIQLREMIAENKSRHRPWPLYFCNENLNDPILLEHRQK